MKGRTAGVPAPQRGGRRGSAPRGAKSEGGRRSRQVAPTGAVGPRVHVAIVLPRCLDRILSGEKTIESRLSLTRREPFGRIAAGDTIYFKERGGPYRAMVIVGGVRSFEGLLPRDIEGLAAEFESRVHGGSGYWSAKRSARYGTLIELTHVQAVRQGPKWVSNGSAWRTFPSGTNARANQSRT